MDQENFELDPAARRCLDDYLDRIERLMMESGLEREQRRSIVDDVEGQALEMLRARTARATEPDVRAVLARLDEPEDYARAASGHPGESAGQASAGPEPQAVPPSAGRAVSAEGSSRFSRTAIIGALMLLPILFFMPLAFGSSLLFFHRSAGFTQVPFLGPLVLSVPLLSLLLMCLFGVVAISQIRHSGGRLHGMGLAVFDALLLPLLLLDGVIFNLFHLQPLLSLPFVRLGMLLCCAALDCLIVWWVWKRVNQPPASLRPVGQFFQSNINIS